MATRIQLRRDTSTNWENVNPTLSEGEIGIETNTNSIKIGNGTDSWVALEYFSVGGITWQTIAANMVMEKNKGYLVNCSSSAITVTLPSSPDEGDAVSIKDYKGSAATYNITVDRNGQLFEGTTSNFIIAANKQGVQLVYSDSTTGWVRVYETHGPAIYS